MRGRPTSGAGHLPARRQNMRWTGKRGFWEYDTESSRVITDLSTNTACSCLTSQIGRDVVFSAKYGRTQRGPRSGSAKGRQTSRHKPSAGSNAAAAADASSAEVDRRNPTTTRQPDPRRGGERRDREGNQGHTHICTSDPNGTKKNWPLSGPDPKILGRIRPESFSYE